MRRYLLDTGIVGDLMNHRHGVDVRVREDDARGDRVGISIPVLCELWLGVEMSRDPVATERRLRHTLPRLVVWPFDSSAAREYGRLEAILRRTGRPMQQIDVQIAAIALTLGNTTVVSADSDLFAVPGLTVENWATP